MQPFDYRQGQVFMRDGLVPFKDANVSIAVAGAVWLEHLYGVQRELE